MSCVCDSIMMTLIRSCLEEEVRDHGKHNQLHDDDDHDKEGVGWVGQRKLANSIQSYLTYFFFSFLFFPPHV